LINGRWRSFRQERAGRRCITNQRMAGMILHPLTEVGIGMLMPVMVGRRQLVMNLQRRGKRRHREQHAREQQRDDRAGLFVGETTKHDHPGEQVYEA